MNGGIDDQVQQRVDAYRSKPQELQKSYAKNQQLIDLLALQKIKSEKDAMARQMQMQAQQTPQTIAQQREAEMLQRTKDEMVKQQAGVLQQKQQQAMKAQQQAMQPRPQAPQGIAGVPAPNMQKMANGGIVKFAGQDGSLVKGADLVPDYGLTNPINGLPFKSNGRTQFASRKEQLEQMIKDGQISPEDVAAITGGELVGEIVNDRPTVREAKSLPRRAGENLRDDLVTVLPDIVSPVKRTAGAVGDVLQGAGEFGAGFLGLGDSDTESTPIDMAKPKETPLAGAKPTEAPLAGDRQTPPAPDMGMDKTLLGGSTISGGAGGLDGVERKEYNIEDFGGPLETDVGRLRQRYADAMGELPDLEIPEINLPDPEAMLDKYSDPMYDRVMRQRDRTQEEKDARAQRIADKEALWAEINDPEAARMDRLWSTLSGAAGTRNLGYMGRNMNAASTGAKRGNQQRRLQGLEAIQAMYDQDQKFRDENRAAGATAGSSFATTGLGQEALAAREMAGREWDKSKSLYGTAVDQGKTIYGDSTGNEKTNLQQGIDLAKLESQDYTNQLNARRLMMQQEENKLYQYQAKLTKALEVMDAIEQQVLGMTHPAVQAELKASAKGIPLDDPIWEEIRRAKEAALAGNRQYAMLNEQVKQLRMLTGQDMTLAEKAEQAGEPQLQN